MTNSEAGDGVDDTTNPAQIDQAAHDKGASTQDGTSLGPNVPPSPKDTHDRHRCKPDQTPTWKIWLEGIALLIAGLVAIVYLSQLAVMGRQLDAMQVSNSATMQAAYAACIAAQTAQTSSLDAHASAIATIYQALATVQNQRAIVSFTASIPNVREQEAAGTQLGLPYDLRNDGRSTVLNMQLEFKAVLLTNKEKLRFDNKNLVKEHIKDMPAGETDTNKASNSKPITPLILVRDINDRFVQRSSEKAVDFMAGGQAIVYTYGSLEYLDFVGKHTATFCHPLFHMRSGSARIQTENEKTCAKHNNQADSYSELTKVTNSAAHSGNAIQKIVCVQPK